MIEPQPFAMEKSASKRIIGKILGPTKGPTFIFFGGIHGNEPAGILALEKVFLELAQTPFNIKGQIFGIRGNLGAITAGKRYLEDDLNRLWISRELPKIRSKPLEELSLEERELLQLYQLLSEILKTNDGPFYFVDIHTTSSKTVPFITINDALINRKFSKCFPLPVVLGIEEYLEGPLLSYINERGYVSLGLESGQHSEFAAVDNAISFIWIALVCAEILAASEVKELKAHYDKLNTATHNSQHFYEIYDRHKLCPDDLFKMEEGFVSFEKIQKGTLLAKHDGKNIVASRNTIVFMPLYQVQGKEGYFLIRKIPKWALGVSEYLRKHNWDNLMSILPGVSWSSNKENLLVNPQVARFFSRSIFHLFGYRRGTFNGEKILMTNRERSSKKENYSNTNWYKLKK